MRDSRPQFRIGVQEEKKMKTKTQLRPGLIGML
jgi:hypothetical protein